MIKSIEAASYLRKGPYAVLLLGTASCDPDMMRLLVDELDVDANAHYTNGASVLYAILDPENDIYDDDGDGQLIACGDNSVLAESLSVVLNAGADPCLDSQVDPARPTVTVLREWGWPETIVETVEEFAQRC